MSDYRRFRLLNGSAETAAIVADRTLTALSTRLQVLSSTVAALSVILPDATTMETGGPVFVIQNTGAFAINIKNAAGIVIASAAAGASTPVYLSDNSTSAGVWYSGTVAEPTIEWLNTTVLNGSATVDTYLYICAMTDTTALVGYSEGSNHFVAVLTIAAGIVSMGTPLNIGNAASGAGQRPFAIRLTDTLAVLSASNAGTQSARALTITGTTVSAGAIQNVTGAAAYGASHAVRLNATQAVMAWQSGVTCIASVVTVTGTTCAFGANTTVPGNYPAGIYPGLALVNSTKVISFNINGGAQNAVTLTIAGTTITASANTTVFSSAGYTSNINDGVVINEVDAYFVNNNSTVSIYSYSFCASNIAGTVPRIGCRATPPMQEFSNVVYSFIFGVRGNYIYQGAGEFIFVFKVLDQVLERVASSSFAGNSASGQSRSAIVGPYILTVFRNSTSTFANVALTSIT